MTDAGTDVQNLVHRYAELIDLGDFDGLGDLLAGAEVGSGDTPGSLTGHDAVVAMFTSTTRRYPDGTPRTKHVTTNSSSRSTRTPAPARAARTSPCSRQVPALPAAAGRRRPLPRPVRPPTTATWRFAERRFFIDLVGDVEPAPALRRCPATA